MCGRYVSPTQAEMERYWDLTDAQIRNPLAQRFNVAPTVQVPIIFRDGETLVLDAARWGLTPFWWKKPKPPQNTFNARSEEAATKPMWRTPAETARCLVPALGWYEWKLGERIDPATGEVNKTKQPYFLSLPGRPVLGFAGLMSARTLPDSDAVELSCSILTREAIGPAAEVHNRMPIVLRRGGDNAWLDPGIKDPAEAIGMARTIAATEFVLQPVSMRVNYSKNEGAELLEPFANPA